MPARRQDSLDRIRRDGAFDVIVVGGGINGIGVFREWALQGLRVLLVERNEFCSGCSAAPSRMIHGGLRYLENGEFGLVREALAERDALLRNAPHMVRPLPTTIPVASVFSGLFNAASSFLGGAGQPARRGAVPIKLGLTLYDLIARKHRGLPGHRFRGAAATRTVWPALTPDLICSATYHDAWIAHPERLGVELVLDTLTGAESSVALNYTELRAAEGTGFDLTDRETGAVLPVTARAVVNAAGAWLDEVNAQLSQAAPRNTPLVSGTKGSHLVLDSPELLAALNGHMIYYENTDGRVCIVFPYLGRVLAGSTDIRVTTVERTRCEPEERDYILGSLRRIFPGISVTRQDIVFSYSGIRPLPSSSAEFTGRIPRGHFVHHSDGPVPLFGMVGGKWTTFRAFAEQTADEVLAALQMPRRNGTADLAIGGGRGFPDQDGALEETLTKWGIAPERAAHLAGVYGTRADESLEFCTARADDQPLRPGMSETAAEIAWLVRNEHVVHLSDIVLRRTPLAITGRIDTTLIHGIAEVAARELGWDDDRTAQERQALIEELRDYHGVAPETLERRSSAGGETCA